MPTQHALLTASGAHRWMHCTPSARLEETLPDSTSEYAAEGTLAHSIAELKVRKKFVEAMSTRSYNSKMKKLEADPLYNPEMQTTTDEYLDYITGIAMSYPTRPYIAVERRLDFSRYVPEGFGTGDCIIIGGDTLHVIDYKHGKGVVVEVENNPQLMLYGLGALEAYNVLYNIKHVALTVVQPRADGDSIKEWTIDRDKLLDWGVFTVRPVAEMAFAGEGEFCGGDWCQFCRARNTCRARAGQYTALEDFGSPNSKTEIGKLPVPPLLSDAEVGEVLQRAIALDKWVEGLKEYALSACLEGKEIPGWKAVEGRSSRSWDNQDEAFNVLSTGGIDEAMLWHREPYTLAQIEKDLGKKTFNDLVGTHVVKSPGKPALAPESDKREAITLKPSAEEDFAEVGTS
ncbi:DUF2800 domain-containing protein [Clostridium sp. KNHs216]|uniref:DUF2800 domain-containing protein n=1 Tax=Clostridium sp. KNHs216 TaxID=1550235 RepID=UPI00114EBD2F|nr:DUF2800 domain-containing protein [Clostridium sp. KNHs216]TQI66236.1 uncharacterized protein DUF2800 [Clostridium sp. KNHs216]